MSPQLNFRFACLFLGFAVSGLFAQETPPGAGPDNSTLAAAAVASGKAAVPHAPDFLEHLVDSILGAFNIQSSGNTLTHYTISIFLLVVALLARRLITNVVFAVLRKLAAKTETTLDDKLFPALEAPAATFVMVVGVFSSLKVLKLSPQADLYIASGSQVAFSLVLFWGLWRGLAALLTHGTELAHAKSLGIAAFMPWISKSLLTAFAIVGVLLTVQSLGYDVKAILAGLGIGGLAFALAAQDTLANIFGAIVVAVDQPFKVGETVKIGANTGTVEDIGLRSTRIRLVDKSLMVIPNKTVAAETITNLSRFTRRRIEQVIGLTYDTKPAQLETLVAEVRNLISAQPEVDAAGVLVYFRDFGPSSLDLWLGYEVTSPDLAQSFVVRQRINLGLMRLIESRGLSFAFPSQTVYLAGNAPARPPAA
jgi:MscS family membrane protein